MSDPLSTAGSVVGIISLGIQVTQSLYDYYSAFKSQPSDVSHTLKKLQSLLTVLQQLSSHLTGRSPPPGDSELAQNIESTVRQCEECIEELEEEVKKFQKTKTDSIASNLKATGRRLAYPFRQSTLHKLDEDIDDLVSRLSFALSLLQQKTVDHIQDDVQDMRAILDLIRAQQVSDEIQDWLNAPDASVNFNENQKKKHPGTGLWLVKGTSFATWLDKQNSFLWLKGFAGCGKSVLCSTAIQHTMRRRGFDSSSRVGVAFFFFTFNDNAKQSTSAMLRALILQLSGQVKGSPIALTQLHKQNKRTAPTDSSLLDCLRQILSTFQDVYILLDALDESPRGTHREAVLDALTEMRGWAHAGTHLHLLVTSRDEVDIRDALQATNEESVLLQSEGIDRDIADFVSQHLRDNRRLHKWRDSYDEIEDVLTQKAKGVFRWVECQFRDLASCPKSPSLLTKLLHSLPQTLDETYERMIQNIPSISRDYARQMLTFLCCATRPLTVPELIDALAVDLSGTPKFDARRKLTDLDGLQEVCPGFIEVDLNKVTGSITVRLAHFSVQEYLESGRIPEDGLAAPFIIRRNHGHATIASICLTLLVHPQLLCLSPDDARTEFPLAQYAAKEWLYHYTKSTQTKRLDAQTIQLMAGGDEPFNSWVHIWNVLRHDGEIYPDNIPTALYYASRYGVQPVVEYLCRPQNLGLNDMLNAQYGEYETPLQAAAAYGHTEAVQLLLQNGANARATHCYHSDVSSPLIAAARFGSCEIVEMLINGGADINAMIGTGYDGTTALYEAAIFDHSDLVRWLLDKGAKTDDIASSSGALFDASRMGNLEVVELLIAAGAQINTISRGTTPLIEASEEGHVKVVVLLLANGADARLIVAGKTAYDAAKRRGHDGVKQVLIEWLINAAIDTPNVDGFDFAAYLEEATLMNDVRLVDLLLTQNHRLPRGGFENDALKYACGRGYEEIITLVLEKGADMNMHADPDTLSLAEQRRLGIALGEAAANGHTRIARLLLSKFSDQSSSTLGFSYVPQALLEASAGGHLETLVFLLQNTAGFGDKHGFLQSAIVKASERGEIDIFDLLMTLKAGPFEGTETNYEALLAASGNGHTAIVERLLNADDCSDAEVGKYGPALSEASAIGNQDIVEKLLRKGADPKGTLALQRAAFGGFTEIVRLLLEHGADPDGILPNSDGSFTHGTALYGASRFGSEEMVRLLLQSGAGLNIQIPEEPFPTPLAVASGNGHIHVVQQLLFYIADAKSITDVQVTELLEALFRACEGGHEEIARLLVNSGADVDFENPESGSKTPLWVSSAHGHVHIVRFLLSKGARVNNRINGHTSALYEASSRGCTSIVQLLLENGAEVNAYNADTEYKTAVSAACSCSSNSLQLLLDYGGDVSSEASTWGSALQVAAYHESKTSMALLLERGADVNSHQGGIGTALQISSQRGRRDMVTMLLKRGADVNMICGGLGSALQILCGRGGFDDLVELLLKHNADVNLQSGRYRTALIAASDKGHGEMAALLLKHGADVNVWSGEHGTALTAAITECHLDIAKTLLEHNAEANTHAGVKGNPSHAAISDNFVATTKLLLDHGADVNIRRGYDDATALNRLAYLGHLHMVELLLCHGADPNINLPLFEAITQEHHDMVKIVLEYGARTDLPSRGHQNAFKAALALKGGNERIIRMLKEKDSEMSHR